MTVWQTFDEIAAAVGWPEWNVNRDGCDALVERVRYRCRPATPRCDVCDRADDDLHRATVDGENLDVCWKCCPDCPTKEAS